VLSGALLVPLSASAAPTDPVLIVNGKTITQQDYDNYVKARAEQTHRTGTKHDVLIQELIQRELLIQDALNNNLNKHPEFIQKLKYMRDSLLMAMAMHDYLEKHSLDDAALRRLYDRQVAHIKVPNEYKVRHILVKTKKKAKAIIAELDEGKSFAKLAKEKSTDIGSAKNEGDMGWITKSTIDPKFGATVAKLEKGQYTTAPVKSEYGWHIIQLDDIRRVALPSFESVKGRLRSAMQNRQMQNYVIGLRKKADIKISNKH
jgi:peptidyl-prolyl cis-trans isomerase C